MFDVVFFRPEIPPNTGNAMRLAAVTGCRLHLVEPLGFDMDDAKLRRAGMDYRDRATFTVHPSLESWHRETNARSGVRLHGRRTHPLQRHRLHPG